MQRLGASTIAERFRPRTIAAGGAVASAATLLLTLPATGVLDALVVAAAALVGVGTAWAWREAHHLAGLPLEVAPVAGTGTVDGATVYRFRARLGRGRAFRDPEVTVRFEPDGAPPVTLPTEPLPAVACGPLTIVVRDAAGRVRPPGRFQVRVRVTSGGRAWEAEATVPADAVQPGRFGGIALVGGRLAFEDGWATLRAEDP